MKIADLMLDGKKLDEGVRLFLEDRNGNPVDEWISVLYIHSDTAQARMSDAMRIDAEAGTLTAEHLKNERDLLRRYSWVLVSDWSLDDEVNETNVKALFTNAPDIRTRIVHYSEQKRLFFPDANKSSSAGRKRKSS